MGSAAGEGGILAPAAADARRALDRRSLRAHWMNGLLAGAHDALRLPLLPLLVLARGGSAQEVALLATAQALASLSGWWPGALQARRLSPARLLATLTAFVAR